MTDLSDEIVEEIAGAIRTLGGDLATINLSDPFVVNLVLEFLGADIYLLCSVGSWGDTMSDEEVLEDLQTWNRDGVNVLRAPRS